MNQTTDHKMSRWGVGPVFAVLSLGYGGIMLAAGRFIIPAAQLTASSNRLIMAAGIALIVVGVPFWLGAARAVMRAYNSDRLVTSGFYNCCRHPLYASWVVFIVPGISLLLNSWLMLTTPVFMYIVLRLLVRKEEAYMEGRFGDDYLRYKTAVPCILPYCHVNLEVA